MRRFKMRNALAFLAVLLSPLLVECTPTCQVGNQRDFVEGLCPIKLSPASVKASGGPGYTECVTVHVWVTADDLKKAPKVEVHSPVQKTFKPVKRKPKSLNARKEQVRCSSRNNSRVALWELVYDCIATTADDVVSVSYSTASTRCTVPDPKPDYDVSVDLSSKSITVTVKPGKTVYVRLCYMRSSLPCSGFPDLLPVTIDPSKTPSVHFNITYLLPCLCIEVYYTHTDASRSRMCPFQKERLADVRDVWLSSDVVLFESSLLWVSHCCVSDLPTRISASLCWMESKHACTPILNSTLREAEDGNVLIYNTSAVDKHPQMCVLFSLQGSQKVSCPFQTDMSSWEVNIGQGRQSVIVYVTSKEPATFSAQFCVLSEMGCAPIGPVHVLTTENTQINIPPHFIAEKPCVQVWQSDPALDGRRILCPDYVHNRWGMYAVAALIFVVVVVLLGIFIHRLTRSAAAGWLYIHKPVLLVCSSEHSAHVSAAVALASVLQGELSAKVHMSLWAQCSQRHAGIGVADLGPIPWLYGQWEAVRKAQGKVLIIWSPEAKKMYEKWSEDRSVADKRERKNKDNSGAQLRHERMKVDVEADDELNERLMKCKTEKAAGKTHCVKLRAGKDWDPQKESSTVTGPVFAATLACLEGALQQSNAPGVAIVYFQGLGHSTDIPKALRGVPRYCLPQDFRGLIQALEGMTTEHCWPRLLSKVLSIWLAQKLASRLQTLLPQSQGAKRHKARVTSSQKIQSQNRLCLRTEQKLPLEANVAEPAHGWEPLHECPQGAERL